jgi:hypothetical protein
MVLFEQRFGKNRHSANPVKRADRHFQIAVVSDSLREQYPLPMCEHTASELTQTAPIPLEGRPLDVVTTCRLKDLGILILATRNLRRFVNLKQLHVVTARRHFRHFEKALGKGIELIDEDTMIPGLTLRSLDVIPQPPFARGMGWYFQQLLKIQFAFHQPEDDYYLIWDADTVPLRKMEFFDPQGRMLFTTAAENNRAYFETYEKLLGSPANREFSFISQHMIVQKSVMREMLHRIEAHCPGDENWAWKIMKNLSGNGYKCFSEYETYGHYVKNFHPELAAFRQIPWMRDGTRLVGRKPSPGDLDRLAEDYYYASFEHFQGWWREKARAIREKIRILLQRRS